MQSVFAWLDVLPDLLLDSFGFRTAVSLTWLWLLGIALDQLCRRRSAALRRDLWFLVSFAAICIPVAVAFGPTWSLGLARGDRATLASGFESLNTATSQLPHSIQSESPQFDEPSNATVSEASIQALPNLLPAMESAKSNSGQSPATSQTSPLPSIRFSWTGFWAGILTVIWATGVMVSFAMAARSLWGISRLIRNALPVESERLRVLVREIRRSLKLQASPQFFESEADCAPACVGILRARILLPPGWRDWSPDTLHGVLAHELAHVARRDLLVEAWSVWVRAVLWTHPISWWAHRCMRVERELAADDLARSVVDSPSTYAAALLDAAQDKTARARDRLKTSFAVSMQGATPMEIRVRRILDDAISRSSPSRFFLAALSMMLFASAFVGASVTCFRARAGVQEPATASTDKPSPRFDEVEVSGKVLNADGSPAVGATISTRLFDGNSTQRIFKVVSTSALSDGRFVIAVHRDQLGTLALLAVGRDPRYQSFRESPFSAEPAAEYWKDIVIHLQEAKSLKAKVVTPSGEPAKGAKVWLEYPFRSPSPSFVATNDQGEAQLWLPNGLAPESGIAFLEGVGVDYTTFREGENVASPRTRPAVIHDDFELKLAPLVEIPVRVVDENESPLPDAWVGVSFRRPGKREFLVRPDSLPTWLQRKTSETGEAILFAPDDVDEPVSVVASKKHFVPAQRTGRMFAGETNSPIGFLWNPKEPGPVKVVLRDALASMTTLRGRVVDVQGQPVANASIAISGRGLDRAMPFHKASDYTDAKGEFAISIPKNMFYLLHVATANQLVAQRSFAVAENAPSDPIEIIVTAAKAVTIRAIDATKALPAPNCPMVVSLTTESDYRRRFIAGDELPKLHVDTHSGENLVPSIYVFRGKTDENGGVKLFLPEGQYQAVSFSSGAMDDERLFQVHDQAIEVEVLANAENLVLAGGGRLRLPDIKIPKIAFKGVVTDENGKPLAGASVQIQTRISLLNVDSTKTVTDAEGQFECDRDPRATLLQVVSHDQTLSASVNIPTDAAEFGVKLSPAPRVIGQLIDAKTNKPLVGKTIEARRGGRNWSSGAPVGSVTDAEGRFVLSPLHIDTYYGISVTEGDRSDFSTYRSATYAHVVLMSAGETLDLKELPIREE